ncbi:hypothetical protein [Planctomyces sp. SH-PL14]|uniref:hypothetical protein n=1 Tax=Planctomyces sp. SH-PL14 TaxID=1632864 RepID=UPI00078D2819|nr:hypothetical protein [Planctomyces sp. SH-PL14]AMV20775.1 hypothetical protein VT03_22935 [Planctomyces sp. SH-PL14]
MGNFSKEEKYKVLSALETIKGLVDLDEGGRTEDSSTAAAAFRSASNFGPERNQALTFAWAERFSVASNRRAICRFSCRAWYENAVMIYDVDQDYQLMAERGNYARSLEELELRESGVYIVTGWHKNGPPSGRRPWFQSPKRVFVRNESDLVVGFEDAGQDDYDDALVTISFRPL